MRAQCSCYKDLPPVSFQVVLSHKAMAVSGVSAQRCQRLNQNCWFAGLSHRKINDKAKAGGDKAKERVREQPKDVTSVMR